MNQSAEEKRSLAMWTNAQNAEALKSNSHMDPFGF
jgi:hypothetical protein